MATCQLSRCTVRCANRANASRAQHTTPHTKRRAEQQCAGFSFDNKHGSAHDFDDIARWVAAAHAGQRVHALALFEGRQSEEPLTAQLPVLLARVRALTAQPEFANGYHLLGHSQVSAHSPAQPNKSKNAKKKKKEKEKAKFVFDVSLCVCVCGRAGCWCVRWPRRGPTTALCIW